MTALGYWPLGSQSHISNSPKETDSGEKVRGQASEVLHFRNKLAAFLCPGWGPQGHPNH